MSSEKIQKSRSFILPLLNIKEYDLTSNGFENIYIGDKIYTGNSNWGEFIFLKFKTNHLRKDFINLLRKHDKFYDKYHPDLKSTVIVFKPTSDEVKTILTPFKLGMYSKICRTYVLNNFARSVFNGLNYEDSVNYKILHKSDDLRRYWNYKINNDYSLDKDLSKVMDKNSLESINSRYRVVLESNSEVWPRPEKEDEILHYNNLT